MYYSIALGVLLSLAAFGMAAFIMDRRYRPTYLGEPPERPRVGH